MAKFHGKVGYGESVETTPGVWDDQITERDYFGDILRNSRQLRSGEQVNPDVTVANSISIVADDHARGHFFAIRYVEWMGVRWTVQDVTVEHPRLILRLGEVYNGPTA